MYSYRELKAALRLAANPLLAAFEQYCGDMRGHERVFEWSCKITAGAFEGARFVHSSLSASAPEVQRALARLYASLGQGGWSAHSLPAELQALARRAGERIILAYGEQGELGDRRRELKVYVVTGQLTSAMPLIERLVPGGATPPEGTPKVIVGASLDERRASRGRVYYLWDRASLAQPRCLGWLAAWCTPEEMRLIESSRSSVIACSFKGAARDMLYFAAPFNQPEINRLLLRRLEPHAMAYREIGSLRSAGFSKWGEGLEARELNAYFTSVFR